MYPADNDVLLFSDRRGRVFRSSTRMVSLRESIQRCQQNQHYGGLHGLTVNGKLVYEGRQFVQVTPHPARVPMKCIGIAIHPLPLGRGREFSNRSRARKAGN
jgi:hypothetical protein